MYQRKISLLLVLFSLFGGIVGAVVGEAWKLLWLARGNAEQGAEELRRFSKFANADPVPRSKKLRRRAELADLVRLSTTLPAFFLKKPVKRKAS